MTATAANALTLSKSQIGVAESPAGSNHVKYSVWYGVTGPWCAMFVSWVWWSIGVRFSGAQSSKGWASAELMRQFFIKHGWYHSTPQPGDVTFFHIPGEHAGANHVGFYLKKPSAQMVRTRDGNTSAGGSRDGGHVGEVDRSESYVLGYGRPPYIATGTSSPTIPPSWWKRTLTLTSPYMDGLDVEAAAQRLIAHGQNPGTPHNIFGPMMDSATRGFQRHVGIVEDGDIGPTTAYKLGG